MKVSQTRVVTTLTILVVLTALVVLTPGCSLVNRVRAKNQLNEAARAYHDGHFEEAEGYSRRALELDPNSKTAKGRTAERPLLPFVFSPAPTEQALVDQQNKPLVDQIKSGNYYDFVVFRET